jgi:hypothetical protein
MYKRNLTAANFRKALGFSRTLHMASTKQKSAARRNIKKAARAARRKRTIAKLSKKTRTALGKEGAKAAARKRRSGG